VENELRRVVDALPGLIWTALPDGRIDFVNRRWCEYTGAGVDEVHGHAWQKALHPEDVELARSRWHAILASGVAGDVELRLRRFDGAYRWFLFRSCPVADASAQIIQWCGTGTDIEDRKREERALREREHSRRRAEAVLAGEKRLLEMVAGGQSMSEVLEGLCRLIESTVDGCHCSVVLVDPSGTRLEHGAAPSLPASFITSIIGRPINIDSGPCAMAAHLNEQVIAADLTTETRWAAHNWCPMALAHGLQACWSTPLASTAGKVLGAFALYYLAPNTPTLVQQALIEQLMHIASVAVERKQSQTSLTLALEELTKSEQRLRTIIDAIPNSVWCAGADGVTSFWNKRWQDYAGFSPAENDGDWWVIVHPDDLSRLQDAIGSTVPRGRAGQVEARLRRFDGEYRWFQSRWEPVRDESGTVVSWYGANTDIDDAKRAEEALGTVRSELSHVARVASLGALTASIAHEVNQPLSGIITNAGTCLRMLAAEPPNVDGARETARRTIRDGQRASEVIHRLRALFAKKGVTSQSVDLNEAAREVIALSSSDLSRNRLILRAELADDLPPVTGDRVQLQQVTLNLLLNASDAMSGVDDRPRQLLIRTEREAGDRVRLSVRDAGVGFDQQNVDRLFEAFYTTKTSGMGIGLSVSRSIIESHHGRLWAAPNEGPGATFSFSIPREPPALNSCQAEGHS